MLLTKTALLNRERESSRTIFRADETTLGLRRSHLARSERTPIVGLIANPFTTTGNRKTPQRLSRSASLVNPVVGQFRRNRKSSSAWTRTRNLAVNSRSLYQLSYRGLWVRGSVLITNHEADPEYSTMVENPWLLDKTSDRQRRAAISPVRKWPKRRPHHRECRTACSAE